MIGLLKCRKDDGLGPLAAYHDDYFQAIEITFNAKLHVSAMKLLLSAIDSSPTSISATRRTYSSNGWTRMPISSPSA